MPYDDPDLTDPMTLNGVAFETDGPEAHREMAECFIEEYARLGFGREQLLRMFRVRGYAGPHLAYRALGEEAVTRLIDLTLARWGGRARSTTNDAGPSPEEAPADPSASRAGSPLPVFQPGSLAAAALQNETNDPNGDRVSPWEE